MRQYVVDAFTDQVFGGNPAAVCILDAWLDEKIMLDITRENNLSETAFAVKTGKNYHLRWFTPGGEIDLCGHATLATAYVIMNFYEKDLQVVRFNTLSGELVVNRRGDIYELDFPIYDLKPIELTDELSRQLVEALGRTPKEVYIARDLLCVYDDEEFIKNARPDLDKIKELDGLLVHITADGSEYDCVSRSFAPKLSVAEDPVCGSGHCHIVPYWSEKLGKDKIVAFQASRRSGVLYCEKKEDRLLMGGKAALYSTAEINIGF